MSATRWRRSAALLAGVAVIGLTAGEAAAQEATAQDAAVAQATQTDSEVGLTVLDRITVVSRTGESALETLGSVSQVAGEVLERRMATNPSEVLFGVPGVAVQMDSKRAASTINIRGLQDFGRVAVIVDGARQNFQRSGHGTQNLFFIDPMLIQQVDVVRGPIANTYGSGAIGGVVFFETKDAIDFLHPDETYAFSVTGQYESNGSGWTTSGTGAYRFSDAFDVLGNVVWRDYGEYKDGDGNRVEGSGFDLLSGMLKSSIRPTENSELKLGWIGADDSWTEGSGAYDADLKQNTFTARYNITDDAASWLDLHVNASYNKSNLDQTYLTDAFQFDSSTGAPTIIPAGSQTTYDLDTYGFDAWNTSRFDTGLISHELTYGGDWLKDEVVTENAGGGSDVYTPSGNRTVWGAYVQDKITYEWLEVIGALRYDNYELEGGSTDNSGDRVSPRITVGVSPFTDETWKGLQFYGTYAEGYRSPSVTETLISGLHPNGVVFPFLPNPDLKPETAKTWEFGVNYAKDGIALADDTLRLKAAYFNNDIDDYIGGKSIDAGTDGCPYIPTLTPIWMGGSYVPTCFQYQNFAEAKIRGFEFEAVYDAGRWFGGLTASIIDGYTIQDGEREDLLTVPNSQVTAHLGMRLLEEKLTIGGEVQYNDVPEGATFADNYTLVNAFASYRPNENFRLDFRADNLFDEHYANPLNATTTDIIYEPGLTLKLAATLRFGG
ncbi:TonB-dependent hemoglobin/transferrin/lactoferrin family receptor [Mesorhizobium xinjiangense]|uniref:TonB-dependent hemoglobin/transferrin/lactoferrin family receptor n=1 Tax=Mesorhizobium xinjiangense TaxID=2678685 RepID=UPI0012ED719B